MDGYESHGGKTGCPPSPANQFHDHQFLFKGEISKKGSILSCYSSFPRAVQSTLIVFIYLPLETRRHETRSPTPKLTVDLRIFQNFSPLLGTRPSTHPSRGPFVGLSGVAGKSRGCCRTADVEPDGCVDLLWKCPDITAGLMCEKQQRSLRSPKMMNMPDRKQLADRWRSSFGYYVAIIWKAAGAICLLFSINTNILDYPTFYIHTRMSPLVGDDSRPWIKKNACEPVQRKYHLVYSTSAERNKHMNWDAGLRQTRSSDVNMFKHQKEYHPWCIWLWEQKRVESMVLSNRGWSAR